MNFSFHFFMSEITPPSAANFLAVSKVHDDHMWNNDAVFRVPDATVHSRSPQCAHCGLFVRSNNLTVSITGPKNYAIHSVWRRSYQENLRIMDVAAMIAADVPALCQSLMTT